MNQILLTASEFITGAYLISAFDIYYENLPAPADLPMKPELIFLDSGGYEVSEELDLSAVAISPPSHREWDAEKHKSVLHSWPREIPTVMTSFDHPAHRIPFRDQVDTARSLFARLGHHLSCLLIKPETDSQHTLKKALGFAMSNIEELRSFDVIGVTEKELGASPLERMESIARLRRALNEAGIGTPIHVFGALDPIAACLYFISGAEIFDGLTWIRYAFADDRCVYVHNQAALAYGLHVRDADLRLRNMSNNYYYLERLQERMKDFQSTSDYSKLPHHKFLRDAQHSLQRRLGKGEI